MTTVQDAVTQWRNQINYAHPALTGLARKLVGITQQWVSDDYTSWKENREVFVEGLDDAEFVSSKLTVGNSHAPVLDFDIPAHLVPSSTPGHTHLYIDVPMSWRQYKRIMKALQAGGVLEKGFVDMSIKRGYSAVRLPWKHK